MWERQADASNFSISSLSSIVLFARVCIVSKIIIWVYVSCVWFAAVPYKWVLTVAFLRIWYCLYACAKWFLKACQVFWPTRIYSHRSQDFPMPPVFRINNYSIFTSLTPWIGVVEASENLNILASFYIFLLYVYGRDFTMAIIKGLDESFKCAVVLVDLWLLLTI